MGMLRRFLNPKSVVVLFILLFVSGTISFADPMYYNYENVGNSENNFPFNISSGKSVQWLFLPGDFTQPTPLTETSQITNVYFYLINGGAATYTNLTIKMAQDNITTFTSGQFYPRNSMEEVYFNSSAPITGSSSSWLKISLDTPFTYDPEKSLILYVEQAGFTGDGMTIRQNGLSDIRRVWSLEGAPFDAYSYSSDAAVVKFGIDVTDAPVVQVPVPGAVLLGSLGLSLAGLRLRRSKI
jgi:hypothetical protein